MSSIRAFDRLCSQFASRGSGVQIPSAPLQGPISNTRPALSGLRTATLAVELLASRLSALLVLAAGTPMSFQPYPGALRGEGDLGPRVGALCPEASSTRADLPQADHPGWARADGWVVSPLAALRRNRVRPRRPYLLEPDHRGGRWRDRQDPRPGSRSPPLLWGADLRVTCTVSPATLRPIRRSGLVSRRSRKAVEPAWRDVRPMR